MPSAKDRLMKAKRPSLNKESTINTYEEDDSSDIIKNLGVETESNAPSIDNNVDLEGLFGSVEEITDHKPVKNVETTPKEEIGLPSLDDLVEEIPPSKEIEETIKPDLKPEPEPKRRKPGPKPIRKPGPKPQREKGNTVDMEGKITALTKSIAIALIEEAKDSGVTVYNLEEEAINEVWDILLDLLEEI